MKLLLLFYIFYSTSFMVYKKNSVNSFETVQYSLKNYCDINYNFNIKNIYTNNFILFQRHGLRNEIMSSDAYQNITNKNKYCFKYSNHKIISNKCNYSDIPVNHNALKLFVKQNIMNKILIKKSKIADYYSTNLNRTLVTTIFSTLPYEIKKINWYNCSSSPLSNVEFKNNYIDADILISNYCLGNINNHNYNIKYYYDLLYNSWKNILNDLNNNYNYCDINFINKILKKKRKTLITASDTNILRLLFKLSDENKIKLPIPFSSILFIQHKKNKLYCSLNGYKFKCSLKC